MNKDKAFISLLTCSAFVLTYVISLVRGFLPKYYEIVYNLKPSEVAEVMHDPTRLALEYSWAYGLAMILIMVVSVVVLVRHPARCIEAVVIGLCAIAMVFWLAMFCFCYEGFCGPMSLHEPPEFSLLEFLRFSDGIFPISLTGLTIPVIVLLVTGYTRGTESKTLSHQPL